MHSYCHQCIQGGCDAFHDLILWDELARCASGGLVNMFCNLTWSLPPIMNAGSQYLK